jgi:hypothetical protein
MFSETYPSLAFVATGDKTLPRDLPVESPVRELMQDYPDIEFHPLYWPATRECYNVIFEGKIFHSLMAIGWLPGQDQDTEMSY